MDGKTLLVGAPDAPLRREASEFNFRRKPRGIAGDALMERRRATDAQIASRSSVSSSIICSTVSTRVPKSSTSSDVSLDRARVKESSVPPILGDRFAKESSGVLGGDEGGETGPARQETAADAPGEATPPVVETLKAPPALSDSCFASCFFVDPL